MYFLSSKLSEEAMNLIHLKEAPKGTSAINLLRTALVMNCADRHLNNLHIQA
jgi:hypothetical protein